MLKVSTFCVAALLCAASQLAVAQDDYKRPWEEYDKLIKSSEAVGALGPTLLGDQVNFYNGGLSFSVTDISLKGNNALPVALTRTFNVSNRKGYMVNDLPMGDWDLDLPRLSGVYAPDWPDTRCTVTTVGAARPPGVNKGPGVYYAPEDYWNGIQAEMPGGGEMLLADQASTKPSTGGPYYWMTANHTYFSCLSTIQNGPGEGFLAITSDGTKYRFDKMAQYTEPSLAGGSLDQKLVRRKNVLYATLVEDRFGNWVSYEFTNGATAPARLESITASDGRKIELGYNAQGRVATAKFTNGAEIRTWTYEYDSTGSRPSLTSVILPDESRWSINFRALSDASVAYEEGQPPEIVRNCTSPGLVISETAIGTVTHPSGATGEFTVKPKRHGRSNVPMVCVKWQSPVNDPNDDVAYYPVAYDSPTLMTKRLSGPGLSAAQWDYTYNAAINFAAGTGPTCTSGDCGAPVCLSDTCAGTAVTTVAGPGSEWKRYTFGNSYRYNEGKLLKVETGTGPGDILRTEVTTYQLAQSGQPFPTPIGTSPQPRGDGFTAEYLRPQAGTSIAQAGETFDSIVNGFDHLARPLSVTRSSSLGYLRTDETEYHDNPAIWVLGQVKSVTCIEPAACNGIVVSKTDYDDAQYALPIRTYSFGKQQYSLTYDTTSAVGTSQRGTVKTFSDGRDGVAGAETTVTLSNWKRGVPQTIQHPATPESPTGATESAVVKDDGTLASVTDENGYTSNYQYDAMGRLKEIAYPTGDSVAWNKTLQSFAATGGTEYGLPSGHWKQTVSTGNGYKALHFDALWRPVVEETYDNTNASKKTETLSLTVKRYDADGRLAFQSYPRSSLANYLDGTLTGTHTTYDALGRVRTVKQDSELGVLTTETTYEDGFKTVVKNPRNYSTTTNYMAFDQPSTDWPVAIVHPEGAYTDITRDVFGKPKAVKRRDASGTTANTRSYVYDGYQQLCKSIESETGSSLLAYDAAGNLAWSASGQPLPNVANCDLQYVAAGDKVTRSYDARNRLKTLTFPDGLGNQTWTYTPDGLTDTITTYNGANQTLPVINAYHYNRRRMLDGQGESISQPGWYTWGIGYGYDANGHLASHAYPDNFTVTYAPNALGQPAQVGSYATNVSYWPNGAIKQFTYGNLITHTLTQNARGLPTTSCDAYGTCASSAVLRDTYAYDPNGNVLKITDGVGTAQRGNRDMTYDGLDRLKTAMSPMFSAITPDSTARYDYDALDNLTHVIAPGRNHQYCYNALWQLEFVREGSSCTSGLAVTTLEYDPQGNLGSKNNQDFVFDFGNRLRAATGLEHYRYDGHGRRVLAWSAQGLGNIVSQYSSAGQLMYQYDQRRAKYFGYLYLGSSLVAIREQAVVGGAVTFKYQHTDALGSPVAVTDANRIKVEYNEYEPFGKVLVPAAPHDGPGYTGHVYDSLTGLNYMQQRYYDPQIGRFLSVDPVTADPKTGGNFNRYWYANNNPYTNRDPDGGICVVAFGATTEMCARSLRYEALDSDGGIRGKTRFFAAASVVTNALAPTLGSSFLTQLSRDLESANLQRLKDMQSGAISTSRSTRENDYAFVHFEQSIVQDRLDQLRSDSPTLYSSFIGTVNGLLNGVGSRGGDPNFAKAINLAKKEVGGNLDFENQDHREALGRAMTDVVRSSRNFCTGSHIRTC